MADYIVTSGELTTVANAIRAKNGTSSNLSWPDGFVSGISSGSGGGGESDFSTAEMTLINNAVDLYGMSLEVPCVLNKEQLDVGAPFPDPESDYNIDVVIYKSTPSYAYITGVPSGHSATCTGSVRVISSSGGAFSFEITGDGSITIS